MEIPDSERIVAAARADARSDVARLLAHASGLRRAVHVARRAAGPAGYQKHDDSGGGDSRDDGGGDRAATAPTAIPRRP